MKRSLLFILAVSLCLTRTAQTKKVISKTVPKKMVEVIYFHSKQRCPTCIAIGHISEEVVNKDLAAQVKGGKLKFKEVDISTTEGEKLGDKYRVTWSSLFVNQWKNGRETRNDLTRFGFENARSNPSAFRTGLKNKILELLK